MVSERQERCDRGFVGVVTAAFADACGTTHHRSCGAQGCWWVVHAADAAQAQAAYEEHLRDDPRHNDRLWTDRYGRVRRGLVEKG